jgi:hypothetical protein
MMTNTELDLIVGEAHVSWVEIVTRNVFWRTEEEDEERPLG